MKTTFLFCILFLALALGLWQWRELAAMERRQARMSEAIKRRARELEENAAKRAERAKVRETQRQQILARIQKHGRWRPAQSVIDDIYSCPQNDDTPSHHDQDISASSPPVEEPWDEWANGGTGIGTGNPSLGVNPVSRHD